MKALNIIVFLLISAATMAQPTLTFEKHAIKPGIDNPMTFCSYSDAGAGGANVIWDFTNLVAVKEFTGHVNDAFNPDFSLANTELEEFGVRFFFDINEAGIQQYGYLSEDGKTRVNYYKPYDRIIFPFAFQDSYSSPFSGEYFSNEKKIAQIDGIGKVESDAWGTIKLPGNIEYDNTLRIKSEKTYILEFESMSQEIDMITYRWYNSMHRYPLLVLIETTVTTNNKSTTSTQAAYNLNAVKTEPTFKSGIIINSQDLKVYPNPAKNELTLELFSTNKGFASISITDLTGKVIVTKFGRAVNSGINKIVLKDEISHLQEGFYILNIEIEGKIMNQEISIID
jgi:hypothetical protein